MAVGDRRRARRDPPDLVRDPVPEHYLVDLFREPHDGATWVCRRDEHIRLPYAEAVRRSPAGVPYLAPELVLLFTAKVCRAKDEHDLAAALPLLAADRRSAPAGWSGRLHPGHPWIDRLLDELGPNG